VKPLYLLLLLAPLATAQTLEARRYRTADGVEVLTSRVAAPKAAPASAVTAPAATPPAAPASRPVVAPAVQAVRDQDRVAILGGELLAEGRMLEHKRQQLRSPKATAEMTAEQLQALRDEVRRHEDNVIALNRELRRVAPMRQVAERQSP
jgi:hypothetical protein